MYCCFRKKQWNSLDINWKLFVNNFCRCYNTNFILQVSYYAGSNGIKLPPIYMKSLDNELIPVLHRITSNNFGENAIVLELIFRILNVWRYLFEYIDHKHYFKVKYKKKLLFHKIQFLIENTLIKDENYFVNEFCEYIEHFISIYFLSIYISCLTQKKYFCHLNTHEYLYF